MRDAGSSRFSGNTAKSGRKAHAQVVRNNFLFDQKYYIFMTIYCCPSKIMEDVGHKMFYRSFRWITTISSIKLDVLLRNHFYKSVSENWFGLSTKNLDFDLLFFVCPILDPILASSQSGYFPIIVYAPLFFYFLLLGTKYIYIHLLWYMICGLQSLKIISIMLSSRMFYLQ